MDFVNYHDVATVLGPNKTDSRQKEEFRDTNIPMVSYCSPSGILNQTTYIQDGNKDIL